MGGRNEHLRVAGERDEPEPEPRGAASRRTARTARWAAVIRVGSTSVARIDCDTSTASITVAVSRGTWTARAGRANAMTMSTSASNRHAAARWRRHPGRVGATDASRSTLVKRTAYWRRWRCTRTYAEREADDEEEEQEPGAGEETHLRHHPSRRGAACRVITYLARSRSQSRSVRNTTCSAPAPRMSLRDLGALARRRLGEAGADLLARGLHLDPAAGFGVDERDEPDRRELDLARVEDLDREHVVADRQRPQGRLPLGVGQEVGDDDDETAAARRAAPPCAARCGGHPPAAGPTSGRGRRSTWCNSANIASRPARAGTKKVRSLPRTSAPTRLPDRLVRKPTAATIARARSRFSNCAVPKSRLARAVDDDPRLELAVGDRVADVGHLGAGGDRPVHAPDVVAHLVLAALARFGARRGHETEMVALEQAVETAEHVELEASERRLDRAVPTRRRRSCRALALGGTRARAGRCR